MEKVKEKKKKLENWHSSANIVFMKLRISIILLGASLLINSGCSSVKSAYNGKEGSRFTNPAKIAALNNPQGAQAGLEPVASGPDAQLDQSGWTGPYHMTGVSTEPQFQQQTSASSTASEGSWGGALSTR
jgi:uncharacterized protein YceK